MDLGLLGTITGLAFVDSINVCALAVLTMVLTTILIQNPEKKRKVLFAGLAFVSAVYVMYLFYGLVIYQVFNSFAEKIGIISPYIYDTLLVLIMIIGALNIKDFFTRKEGGFATEMPLFLRPKVKKIINSITSIKGAFLTGFFVTLFLLPCTIAPLIAAMGILSNSGYTIVQSIPWLLYYNLLFVLPMLAIVGLVYLGFTRVEEATGWRLRNKRYLHLIAGILLLLIGFTLLMGWF